MRVLIVHNPEAGNHDLNRDVLLKLSSDAGYDPVYTSSSGSGWKEILQQERFDLCVAAGGDGTVGKLGRKLVGLGVPLGVLPLGTANNIAAALGVPDAPVEELIASWGTAERRAFDVGLARGPWGSRRFLESLGVGLLAHCIAKIDCGHGDGAEVEQVEDPDAQLEAARGVLQAELEILRPAHVQVTVDERDASGSFLALEVMNCGWVGPALRLNPGADPHDGMLDLVGLGEERREELLGGLRHPGPDGTRVAGIRKGHRMRLRTDARVVHIDDWLWHAEEQAPVEIDISVEPGALTVAAPGAHGRL